MKEPGFNKLELIKKNLHLQIWSQYLLQFYNLVIIFHSLYQVAEYEDRNSDVEFFSFPNITDGACWQRYVRWMLQDGNCVFCWLSMMQTSD